MMVSSTIARGFQLFKKDYIWKHFDWTFGQTENRKIYYSLPWIYLCVLNSQKTSCDQSKYFQNIEACFSEEQILFHRFFSFSEIDQFRKLETLCWELVRYLRKTKLQSDKVNILLNSLCG